MRVILCRVGENVVDNRWPATTPLQTLWAIDQAYTMSSSNTQPFISAWNQCFDEVITEAEAERQLAGLCFLFQRLAETRQSQIGEQPHHGDLGTSGTLEQTPRHHLT